MNTKGYITIIQEPLHEGEKAYYKKVYLAIDWTLHPTPFAMPKEGMWYFDGQFFSQKPFIQAYAHDN